MKDKRFPDECPVFENCMGVVIEITLKDKKLLQRIPDAFHPVWTELNNFYPCTLGKDCPRPLTSAAKDILNFAKDLKG